MKHLVIIGNSSAGYNAAIAARDADKTLKITIISDEKYPIYCRYLVCDILSGGVREKDIFISEDCTYDQNKINLIKGKKVEKINTNKNWIIFTDKTKIAYDALVIASGMSASLPKSLKGSQKHGVMSIRSIGNIEDVFELIPISSTACVYGGGIAGMQAAYALSKKRLEVKIITSQKQILPGLLDDNGVQFIGKRLAEKGIEVITGKNIEEIFGDADVKAIKLSTGKVIGCDIVIVDTNYSANTKFLEDSGVAAEDITNGVVVDQYLRTNIPNIFAAGDVVKRGENQNNLVDRPNSWVIAKMQGKTAGANAADFLLDKQDNRVECVQYLETAKMKILDLPLAASGVITNKEGIDLEEFSYVNEELGKYEKIVLSGANIVGYLGIGTISEGEIFEKLIQQKIDISSIKDDLIDEDFNVNLLRDMLSLNSL